MKEGKGQAINMEQYDEKSLGSFSPGTLSVTSTSTMAWEFATHTCSSTTVFVSFYYHEISLYEYM